MAECEEPGCTRQAIKDWKGRKVCADHYEFYLEQYDRITTGIGI